MRMMQARALGDQAMAPARPLAGTARWAAFAAGQAACVGHVADHGLRGLTARAPGMPMKRVGRPGP